MIRRDNFNLKGMIKGLERQTTPASFIYENRDLG